jgi:hypothetical protein
MKEQMLVYARALAHPQHSNVMPSEVEAPLKCGVRYANRRGPSTSVGMTTAFEISAVYREET